MWNECELAERISSYKETELVSHLLILGGGSDTVLFDLRCLTLLLLASFAWLQSSLIIPGIRVHTPWPVFAMHGHARTKNTQYIHPQNCLGGRKNATRLYLVTALIHHNNTPKIEFSATVIILTKTKTMNVCMHRRLIIIKSMVCILRCPRPVYLKDRCNKQDKSSSQS